MLSKAQLDTLIQNTIIDNTSGLISAADMRDVLTEIVSSEANLITNANLLGLGEWDSTFTYGSGGCAVYNNTIFKCIVSSSTVGTFIPNQWRQIASYIESTAGLGIYLEKNKGIELNNNKLIPAIATDTSFTSAVKTGFYMIEAITVPTGEAQEYPELGKGLLSVYKRSSQSESLLFYYPFSDLTHYYVKVANGNWSEFKSYSETELTYTNGISKVSNEVFLGGDFDTVTLTGNATSTFTIDKNKTFTLKSGYNGIQGTTGIVGNTSITGTLSNTGNISLNNGAISTDTNNLNITKPNTNVGNLNVNGSGVFGAKASYTNDFYADGNISDLNIPTWKKVRTGIGETLAGTIFTSGLTYSTSGNTVKWNGTLTEHVNIDSDVTGEFNKRIVFGGNKALGWFEAYATADIWLQSLGEGDEGALARIILDNAGVSINTNKSNTDYYGYGVSLKTTNTTQHRNIEFPDKSGTLAVTSDLYQSGTNFFLPLSGGTMLGNVTMSYNKLIKGSSKTTPSFGNQNWDNVINISNNGTLAGMNMTATNRANTSIYTQVTMNSAFNLQVGSSTGSGIFYINPTSHYVNTLNTGFNQSSNGISITTTDGNPDPYAEKHSFYYLNNDAFKFSTKAGYTGIYGQKFAILKTDNLITNDRTYQMPDASGTIALREDFAGVGNNRTLIDSNITTSLNWNNRTLYGSYGSVSIQWDNRILKDQYSVKAFDWSARKIYDSYGDLKADFQDTKLYGIGGDLCIDWAYGYLRGVTSSLMVDWRNAFAYDYFEKKSIEWHNRFLDDNNEIKSVDWNARQLFDSSGGVIIDWNNRTLNDSYGDVKVDYENMVLHGIGGDEPVNWAYGYLKGIANSLMLDWRNAYTYDWFGKKSIDWNNRQLLDTDENVVLDWSNGIPTTAGTNGLKTIGGGVGLGGTLTERTIINANGNYFKIDSADDFFGPVSGTNSFILDFRDMQGNFALTGLNGFGAYEQVGIIKNGDKLAVGVNQANTIISNMSDSRLDYGLWVNRGFGQLYLKWNGQKVYSASGSLMYDSTGSIPAASFFNRELYNESGNSVLNFTADDVVFPTTGAITVPVGDTSQRPASPTAGMIRFNTTTNKHEGYDGTTWNNLY